MNRKLLSALLPAMLVLLLAAAGLAQEFKAPVASIDLQDGDTFVFLGDSITHQCLYTQYVEDYFYTRYPGRRIHFHNSGVGGDTCADALARFDQDVAPFKAKYVTILLGMNDGRYTDFKQDIFDRYQTDMNTVLKKIQEAGAIAVPMTPTMFDTRAARLRNSNAEPRNTYYNGVLALYGAWLREQAFVRGLGFVDMYSPLNNLTTAQRKTDARFTMIPDAVHPAPPGQVVMAAAILEDLHSNRRVSAVTLLRKGDGWKINAGNGKAADIKSDGGVISFQFTAAALPWVLPPEANLGYQLTKAGHRLSNERVQAVGLAQGKYELRIDGQPVGVYNDVQLSRGVELQANEKTPQYQQALAVAMLNKARNDQAVHLLRNLWGQRKGIRRDEQWLKDHADDKDAPAKRKKVEAFLATFNEKVAAMHAKANQFEEQIYRANQPKPHRYELAPAAAK